MVSLTASTRQPPAGGPSATVDLRELLALLQDGDRDAFAHYFRLFRAPVHHFAWRLLRDERAAVDATTAALVGVFRRAILHEGADDLEVLTYVCALEACEARAAAAGVDAAASVPSAPPEARRSRRGASDSTRQRFDAALEALDVRPRAALLLHDLAGFDVARSAVVFGLSDEGAAALLFKAREEFRTALRRRDGYLTAGSCRQAGEAVAASVGLGMSEPERSRLARHAGYCRPCRRAMMDWTGTDAGLAVALAPPPLPQALAATPVFGDGVVEPATKPAHRRALAASARALRARATAWVVALACVAVATGVVVHGLGVQPLVLMQSVGPAIRLIVTPPAAEEPANARPAVHASGATSGTPGNSTPSAGAQTAATQSATSVGLASADSGPSASSSNGSTDGRQAATNSTDAGSGHGDRHDTQDERVAARAARWAAKAARAAARVVGEDEPRAVGVRSRRWDSSRAQWRANLGVTAHWVADAGARAHGDAKTGRRFHQWGGAGDHEKHGKVHERSVGFRTWSDAATHRSGTASGGHHARPHHHESLKRQYRTPDGGSSSGRRHSALHSRSSHSSSRSSHSFSGPSRFGAHDHPSRFGAHHHSSHGSWKGG